MDMGQFLCVKHMSAVYNIDTSLTTLDIFIVFVFLGICKLMFI